MRNRSWPRWKMDSSSRSSRLRSRPAGAAATSAPLRPGPPAAACAPAASSAPARCIFPWRDPLRRRRRRRSPRSRPKMAAGRPRSPEVTPPANTGRGGAAPPEAQASRVGALRRAGSDVREAPRTVKGAGRALPGSPAPAREGSRGGHEGGGGAPAGGGTGGGAEPGGGEPVGGVPGPDPPSRCVPWPGSCLPPRPGARWHRAGSGGGGGRAPVERSRAERRGGGGGWGQPGAGAGSGRPRGR